MTFFSGKVVTITGSSNGIGRGTAVLFAKQGAKVAITGRNATSLQETKRQCVEAGARDEDILELIGDITDASFCARLISETVEKFGKLDVLVNNAGGGSFENYGKSILDIPLSEFDLTIDLNVKQVLRLSQLSVPHLEKTRGAIVNVSSAASQHMLGPVPHYSAAKSALDQITIQMAGSLVKKGIRVNSVNPGPVATNAFACAGASPEDQEKIILFLADRTQSEILIGHIVTADGGFMINRAIVGDVLEKMKEKEDEK